MSDVYSEAFFEAQQTGSAQSADVVVPLFLALFPVRSVVDVGCGVGGWLARFAAAGVEDHLGVDGAYVPRHLLRVDQSRFREADLTQSLTFGRRFEAAVCLEVAEHLPAAAGEVLVRTLTDAAPVILFSAAVPFQGGTDHLNEQWPSYWAERFAAQGFVAVDAIRPAIQWDRRVEFWYRQNTLVFCRPERVPPGLRPARNAYELDRVDMELYCYLKNTVDKLPKA